MNKLIPIVLFLFNGFGLSAQTNLDSLLGVWNDGSLADTSRLKAIDQIGIKLLNSAPDSAIHFASLQHKFAEEKGLKEYQADALDILGQASSSKGNLSESVLYHQRAFEVYEDLGLRKKSALSFYSIGRVKWTGGEYVSAMEHYNKSMTIAQEIGDNKRVSRCLDGIAYCYFKQGQYVKTVKYIQQSLELSRELEDDWALVGI